VAGFSSSEVLVSNLFRRLVVCSKSLQNLSLCPLNFTSSCSRFCPAFHMINLKLVLCSCILVFTPWKGKVKLSLCFNWTPHHEGVLGEWRYSSTHSLTWALGGGKWAASRTSRFTPRERSRGTHWIGSLVGSRAIMDAVVKRKIPSPLRETNPRTPIVQPVAQRYTVVKTCGKRRYSFTLLPIYPRRKMLLLPIG
jgi:hypothetical protein